MNNKIEYIEDLIKEIVEYNVILKRKMKKIASFTVDAQQYNDQLFDIRSFSMLLKQKLNKLDAKLSTMESFAEYANIEKNERYLSVENLAEKTYKENIAYLAEIAFLNFKFK